MRKMLFLLFVSIALSWQCRMVCAKSESNEPAKSTRKTIKENLTDEQNRKRMHEMALKYREKHAKKRREELDKIRKAKIEERERTRKPGALAPKAGAGEGSEKQLAALEKKLSHETAKHNKRIAKLNRMQKLAQEKKSEDLTSRIAKLLLKEGQRHNRKLQKIQMQKRKFMRMGPRQRWAPGGGLRPPPKGTRPPVNKRPPPIKSEE